MHRINRAAGISAIAAAGLVAAACGSHTVSPASKATAKASAKAEASALAGLPAAATVQTDVKKCVTVYADPLHPVKMADKMVICLKADFPGASVNTLASCAVKVYVTDRGNTAKENAGYNTCAQAAEK